MHADDAVVRHLPHVAAIIIGHINLLVPASRGDEGDLAGGESLVARDRFDDVVGKAMRVLASSAAVILRENGAAAVIGHLALQDFRRWRFPSPRNRSSG